MVQDIIHVYLMPGMAANPTIFEHIKLPEDKFKIHWLEWFLPEPKESLESYAKRMIERIEYDNVVLLGVSFGGILVQEMSKYMNLRKLFVVSSVKSKHELPKRMKVMKYTKAYKLLPTQLVGNIDVLAKYAFGETITKRIDLYKKYLSVNDKAYLDWAIENVIEWNQNEPNMSAIYIHGDNDMVFPHSCKGDCIVIKGGSHIMIINKFKWFNENLPKLILQPA
ncbi:alpha/beta hydrolase [Psychroserpens sp.]|uniref:alpha/beta hydrolase n=1 Tax=Psychroserpens sp. TaxID=2020870 RepID=UPI001B073019|nr:alpha/beta hydrolase [Psychroserpens sp.]MBO6607056.1 alpha/beta hydrolase [Psychroserpens sp.]MBO6630739.1 alpha/beta hydrolase [Psychroserpens sp.]MBO6654202.1 alpha/beta hydrolase [Psychroserpens sp.]MBO6682512.1 alpha/beta hydrolase [Psychroserpens sp.]MBO6750828.1 alpha/beta hydrolase [Psychroserpens sp.]